MEEAPPVESEDAPNELWTFLSKDNLPEASSDKFDRISKLSKELSAEASKEDPIKDDVDEVTEEFL